MRRRRALALGLAGLPTGLTPALAGSSGNATLQGTVKLADGKPAANAAVFVDGFVTLQAFTGKDGKFRIKNVPWGLQTLVAILRSYKPGKRLNLEVKRGGNLTVDFTLEADPNYQPDLIKLEQLVPAADAILPPGKEIDFGGLITYELRNATNAKVVLTVVDERGNPLLPTQGRYDIRGGKGSFAFRRKVLMPARFGNAEVFLTVAIVQIDRGPLEATQTVGFQVRNFLDEVKFGALAWSRDADQIRVAAVLDYSLHTVERGTMRLRLLADEGKGDYAKLIYEDNKPIDKGAAPNSSLDFRFAQTIPPRAQSLKLRVDLIPQGSPDPKLVKWSKPHRLAPPQKLT